MSTNTLIAIAVTAELTGATFSRAALEAMEKRLDAYPEAAVMQALERCQIECRRPVTMGDIMDRLAGADGRPAADEAWAIAVTAFDETETVVWTEEMAVAFGIAKPILDNGDDIGARMAFRAAYERRVADARAEKRPAKWKPSIGTDPTLRALALERAVTNGQIGHEHAIGLLPPPETEAGRMLAGAALKLIAVNGKQIADTTDREAERAKARKRFEEIRAMLEKRA